MSEEKKTVGLKDEELDKVNGGFEIQTIADTDTLYSFTAGDCFQLGPARIKVKHSYINISEDDNITVLY